MEKSAEALKTLSLTLEKYRKNKTLIPKADLEGKYKVPFGKLTDQLESDLQEFFRLHCLAGKKVLESDKSVLLSEIETIFREDHIGARIGKAAFEHFSIEEIKSIADELRSRIEAAYMEYVSKHTCLYITTDCVAAEGAERPGIYNQVLGQFYNLTTGQWDNPAPGEQKDAVFVFL